MKIQKLFQKTENSVKNVQEVSINRNFMKSFLEENIFAKVSCNSNV